MCLVAMPVKVSQSENVDTNSRIFVTFKIQANGKNLESHTKNAENIHNFFPFLAEVLWH